MKYLFTLLSILILVFGNLSPSRAASSGFYISAKIGEEGLARFLNFKVIDQSTPTGTTITYQFAGSQDGFSSWSNEQAAIEVIDLTKITQLSGSKYLKVKINLKSDNNLPSLAGFEVAYETTVSTSAGTNTNSTQLLSTAVNQNAASQTQQNSSSSAASSSTAQTKSQKISLGENQLKQKNLVTTGGNLWVNLGLAGLVTLIIAGVLFYKDLVFLHKSKI